MVNLKTHSYSLKHAESSVFISCILMISQIMITYHIKIQIKSTLKLYVRPFVHTFCQLDWIFLNTNRKQFKPFKNGTIGFCFIAEKARLVTLEHLHSFSDTCTEGDRAESTDLWSVCMGLKKLLKWENSVEFSRNVKFSSQMQTSIKYTEKRVFKGLPPCGWRIIIGLGITENTGMCYYSGKLPTCSKISQAQCM